MKSDYRCSNLRSIKKTTLFILFSAGLLARDLLLITTEVSAPPLHHSTLGIGVHHASYSIVRDIEDGLKIVSRIVIDHGHIARQRIILTRVGVGRESLRN